MGITPPPCRVLYSVSSSAYSPVYYGSGERADVGAQHLRKHILAQSLAPNGELLLSPPLMYSRSYWRVEELLSEAEARAARQ